MNKKEQEEIETGNENSWKKKTYESPACESYRPLDLMSQWQDKSSELVF